MKNLQGMILMFVIGWFACVPATAGTLSEAEQAKLHPFFKQVLAEKSEPGGAMLQRTAPVVYDAIVYTSSPDAVRAAGIHVNSAIADFVTVQLTSDDVERLARIGEVSFIDPGSTNTLHNDLGIPETGAALLHGGFINSIPYKGQGSIVLVYDTGIDFTHLDFRNPSDTTKSRILAIWDQTLTATGSEAPPSGFSYGVEYTQTQINNEVDGSPAGFLRTRDIHGHGTHVCGTAAGNGRTFDGRYTGMAPLADIIVVRGGDNSFSESRMIDGLTYAGTKAAAAGKPIAVNFSIGGQTGPHDGTRAYEVAITSFTSTPGRVVVISAGNDGAVNMHVGGSLAASSTLTFTFTVPGYTPTTGTENDEFFFDLWFDENTSVTATATSPNGVTYTRAAGETGDSPTTTDGTITVWNYTSSLNSLRNIQFWVHDKTTSTPATGTWTLAVTNNTTNAVPFDGWMTDRAVGAASVTLTGGNNAKSVSMPATAVGGITVASYVTKWGWPSYIGSNRVYSGTDRTENISTFSSIGPTRDGRQKPDFAAPGQGISSAMSSFADTTGASVWIHPGQKHWLMQGTSMAAPHVTGASALLLGIAPSLTVDQIRTLLSTTANTDAFTGSVWNATWGVGKMDVLEAVARYFTPGATITRKIFAYDLSSSNTTVRLTGSAKLALRFSPDVSGRLTGMLVNATTINNRPIIGEGPLKCEIYTSNAGEPGAKLGNTVLHPLQLMSAGTMNYVQLSGSGVSVTSGTDYFVVMSQTNATDTLIIRGDTSTAATRSLYNGGSSWGAAGTNYRVRPIVSYGSGVTDVAIGEGIPQTYALEQNFPNPFNPSTTIRFSIPVRQHVTLRIFNLLGQEIATLVDDAVAAGDHAVQWKPERIASGTYFYRLEAGSYRDSKKVVYLK
jgi:subtilisin family serine protease